MHESGSPTASLLFAVFALCAAVYVVSLRRRGQIRARPEPAVEKQVPLAVNGILVVVPLLAGAIALELSAFLVSGSRIVEGIVGVAVACGGSILLLRDEDRVRALQPDGYEAAALRKAALLDALCAFSAAVNIFAPFVAIGHGDQRIDMLANVLIAADSAWSH